MQWSRLRTRLRRDSRSRCTAQSVRRLERKLFLIFRRRKNRSIGCREKRTGRRRRRRRRAALRLCCSYRVRKACPHLILDPALHRPIAIRPEKWLQPLRRWCPTDARAESTERVPPASARGAGMLGAKQKELTEVRRQAPWRVPREQIAAMLARQALMKAASRQMQALSRRRVKLRSAARRTPVPACLSTNSIICLALPQRLRSAL